MPRARVNSDPGTFSVLYLPPERTNPYVAPDDRLYNPELLPESLIPNAALWTAPLGPGISLYFPAAYSKPGRLTLLFVYQLTKKPAGVMLKHVVVAPPESLLLFYRAKVSLHSV